MTVRPLLLAVGLAQVVLVVLAFARVLDPGWGTFGLIGCLAGVGMAAAADAASPRMADRRALAMTIGLGGTLAGLASFGVWLSLAGGPFLANDLPRIEWLTAADLAFSVSLLAAALADRVRRVPMLRGVTILIVLRTAIELLYLRGLLWPAPPTPAGASSGLEGILAGLVVIGGWLVLAAWEIVLGLSGAAVEGR